MGLKPDWWIMKMARTARMIEPFESSQVRVTQKMVQGTFFGKPVPADNSNHSVISYGVSSYGYDMRVACEYKIFTDFYPGIIDPKAFVENSTFHEHVGDVCIVPPNSFALARSIEYFRIPEDVLCICIGKSTYARCGIIVNVTALEPGWEGQVTIEISNTTPLPAKIYSNEGIVQVLFLQGDDQCQTTYKQKRGKYQGQTGITLPKV